MNVLPDDPSRRRTVLWQYVGVAGGGWLGGLLFLVQGSPLAAAVLLVPCTALLLILGRALRA